MLDIPLSARHSERRLVTPEIAIDFLGPESARVLSTPSLIGLFEMACRNLLRHFLPPGSDSVGAWVEVRHLAPTPLGMEVTLEVEIIGVDGRRVRFRLEASDEREKIAEGSHERVVIDVERFASRVQQKASSSKAESLPEGL
ncbi:MAG: thioesterase family protein [Bryobacteraceae bacterium]